MAQGNKLDILRILYDSACQRSDLQEMNFIRGEIDRELNAQQKNGSPWSYPLINTFQSTPVYSNLTATFNNSNSQMAYRFNQGDRVALLKIRDRGGVTHNNNEANPIWGDKGDYIAGVVKYIDSDKIKVDWDNGHYNVYYNGSATFEIAKPVKKSAWGHKSKGISSIELDRLVIKPEVKTEILAVLKQHQHSNKLFEEWGLGEVIEYGRGMTFCFWGGPGTGKTWGAHCIAKSLGCELMIVSAGDIQSSEPGGANRAITEAFKTASKGGKVLFIDECDSLITVRSEVGMILGSEINTLLTEIEKFEGVLILATNRIGNMDEALERRIALTVEFPEPDFDARKQIWEKMLPKKMPVEGTVSALKLAEQKLTGGQIKNVLLQAARLAAAEEAKEVSLAHFEQATKRVHDSKGIMGKGSPNLAKVSYDKVRI